MAYRRRRASAQRMRRQQRKKAVWVVNIRSFREDAPAGTYHIDHVLNDLILHGAKFETISPLMELRHNVWLAGRFALLSAKNHFELEPTLRWSLNQLYSDLRVIQTRLGRVNKLQREYVVLGTQRTGLTPYITSRRDEIDELWESCIRMAGLIDIFCKTYKVRKKPGNYDPLTRWFLFELVELWCGLISGMGWSDEEPLFFRLLVAAWRDLNLPSKEAEGLQLERWLGDRLRKQFPEGVRSHRLCRDRIYLDLEADSGA